MMETNRPLKELKGKIRAEGTSYRRVSADVGMSLKAFNEKINGKSAFTVEEAEKVMKVLSIDLDEMARFFVPGCVVTKQ